MEKIYVWYSGATDVTGKNLVEGLTAKLDSNLFQVMGGTTKPQNVDVIIGYGAKTSQNVNLGSEVVLNHPNQIRINRNKLEALKKMKTASVPVPNFAPVGATAEIISNLIYPVILRTNYHQGGRGLAICTTYKQVVQAIRNSNTEFGYIQELVSLLKEYRIHVFNGKIMCIAEKVVQSNPVQSWKANYLDKITVAAGKNDISLDNATAELCLKIIAKDLTLPDFIVRSNKHGWGFKRVVLSDVSPDLKTAAKNAVKAINLDFGAVDCAIGHDGKVHIIEVNTGPGLQGRTLTSYVDNFAAHLVELQANSANTRAMHEEMNELLTGIRTLNARVEELSGRMPSRGRG